MTDVAALRELLEKVQAGEDPDTEAFGHALGGQMMRGHHAYFGSFDAAEALRKAVLPKSKVTMIIDVRTHVTLEGRGFYAQHALHETTSVALLKAILKAKIQEADT